MKIATIEDKQKVIDILSKSFDQDGAVNYLIPQDHIRKTRIRNLVANCYEVTMLTGEVYLSEDERAAALVVNPEIKLGWLQTAKLDIQLIFTSIGISNVIKALRRDAKLKSRRQTENVTYLWFLGVDPHYQRRGIGRRMLQEIIFLESSKNKRLVLECSQQNLNWYIKSGFEVYDQLEEVPFQNFMQNITKGNQ